MTVPRSRQRDELAAGNAAFPRTVQPQAGPARGFSNDPLQKQTQGKQSKVLQGAGPALKDQARAPRTVRDARAGAVVGAAAPPLSAIARAPATGGCGALRALRDGKDSTSEYFTDVER